MKAATIRKQMLNTMERQRIERLKLTDSLVKCFTLVQCHGIMDIEHTSKYLGVKRDVAGVKLRTLWEMGYLYRENCSKLPNKPDYYYGVSYSTIGSCIIMRAMLDDKNRALIKSLRLTETTAHILELIKNRKNTLAQLKPLVYVGQNGLNAQLNKLVTKGYLTRTKVKDDRNQSVWHYSLARQNIDI